MAECIIEVKDLWTQFGDNIVHRGIDLCVERGEIMSLVGGWEVAKQRCCARCSVSNTRRAAK